MADDITTQTTDDAAEFLATKDTNGKGKKFGNPFNHNPKPDMLTSNEVPEWLPAECNNLQEYVYAWLIRKFMEPMEITSQAEATKLIKAAMEFRPTYLERQAVASSGDLLAKIESNPALMAMLKARLGAK